MCKCPIENEIFMILVSMVNVFVQLAIVNIILYSTSRKEEC